MQTKQRSEALLKVLEKRLKDLKKDDPTIELLKARIERVKGELKHE